MEILTQQKYLLRKKQNKNFSDKQKMKEDLVVLCV